MRWKEAMGSTEKKKKRENQAGEGEKRNDKGVGGINGEGGGRGPGAGRGATA